ncbi:MAG TPA: universal stress protein [Candidatus Polarisedimenticolia bacterium]|nr:universal stress protein [Candidatus Polarisedimenticolia bacterium]
MKKTRRNGGGEESGRRWILVGVDFSRPARQALVEARHVAREREGSLVVLHVIEAHGLEETARLAEVPERHLRELLGRERRQKLEALLREVEDGAGEVTTEIAIAWGHPFEEILRQATDRGVELIVLGTAGRSADLERALFGSTAEKVLRATPCAVLCVPME